MKGGETLKVNDLDRVLDRDDVEPLQQLLATFMIANGLFGIRVIREKENQFSFTFSFEERIANNWKTALEK